MPSPKLSEKEVAWRCLYTLKTIFETRGKCTECFDFIGDGPSEMRLGEHSGEKLLKEISRVYDGTYILFDYSNGKSIIGELTKFLDDHPEVEGAILVIFSTEFVVQKMKKLTSLTHQANSAIDLLTTQKNVQVFFAIDLMVDIMASRLQPKFRILDEQEAKKVIDSYASLPPPIFTTDPVIKYLGAPPGTVIEIESPSTSFLGGNTFSYSIVVNETDEYNEPAEE